MKVARGAATTIKGKSGRAHAGLFRQQNCNASGNRNGRTIKKYDRALIDVKTTTQRPLNRSTNSSATNARNNATALRNPI